MQFTKSGKLHSERLSYRNYSKPVTTMVLQSGIYHPNKAELSALKENTNLLMHLHYKEKKLKEFQNVVKSRVKYHSQMQKEKVLENFHKDAELNKQLSCDHQCALNESTKKKSYINVYPNQEMMNEKRNLVFEKALQRQLFKDRNRNNVKKVEKQKNMRIKIIQEKIDTQLENLFVSDNFKDVCL